MGATLTDCEILDLDFTSTKPSTSISGGGGEAEEVQVQCQWKPLASLNVARSGARAAVSSNRFVVVAGGCDDVFGSPETLISIEVLDIFREIPTWDLLDTGRLRVPRTTAAIAAFPGRCGDLLVFGGSPSLSSGEILRRSKEADSDANADQTQTWHSETIDGAASPVDSDDYSEDEAYAPALERGRMGAQAAGIELSKGSSGSSGMVVVLGGESGAQLDDDGDMIMDGSRQLSCVESFIPSGRYYKRLPAKTIPDLPEARTAMGCCVARGWANVDFFNPNNLLHPQGGSSDVERAGS